MDMKYVYHTSAQVECRIQFHPNSKRSVIRDPCYFHVFNIELDDDGFPLPSMKGFIRSEILTEALSRYDTNDFVILSFRVTRWGL